MVINREALAGILATIVDDGEDDAVSWVALADSLEEAGLPYWHRPTQTETVASRAVLLIEAYGVLVHGEHEHYTNGMEWASHYEEPGYTEPPSGLIIAWDWNARTDATPELLGRVLERMGVACEWSDEWTTCSDCGAFVRTQPDSYSWEPAYTEGDGEVLCRSCQPEPEQADGEDS